MTINNPSEKNKQMASRKRKKYRKNKRDKEKKERNESKNFLSDTVSPEESTNGSKMTVKRQTAT